MRIIKHGASIMYEVMHTNQIDDLFMMYQSMNKKLKDARELKKQINQLMQQQEMQTGKKLYSKIK